MRSMGGKSEGSWPESDGATSRQDFPRLCGRFREHVPVGFQGFFQHEILVLVLHRRKRLQAIPMDLEDTDGDLRPWFRVFFGRFSLRGNPSEDAHRDPGAPGS